MIIALYCIVLLLLGYVSFCAPIGIIVFRKLCVRSVYEKTSFVASASHVKDEKIMPSLLAAKERWRTKKIEKVSIKMNSFRGIGTFFSSLQSANLLRADLLLNKQFKKNKTLAILVHGFTDSASGMAYLAESYHERGVSTLSVNLRSHGESDGVYSGHGCFLSDGSDIAQWVSFAKKRFGNDTKVLLHGVSMGGASVIQAAYAYGLPVELVVSDCSFSDYSQNVKTLIRSFFPKNWFSSFLITGIYASAAISSYFINGFSFEKNNPKKILALVKERAEGIPLLIFHGEKDSLVNVLCAEELYAAAKPPKSLTIFKNAPHIGSWFYDKKKYMDTVFRYLQD